MNRNNNNRALVILQNKSDMNKVKKYLNGENMLLFLDEDISIKGKNPRFRAWKEFENSHPFDSGGREYLEAVREWGDIKINGKTLREFLTYKGMPFWDIIERNLAIQLFAICDKFQSIRSMKKIMEEERPGKILAEDTTMQGRAGICVAKTFGVEVERIRPHISDRFKCYYDSRLQQRLLRYAYRTKEMQRSFSSKNRSKASGKKRKKILVIPTIQTETAVIAPVIKELEKNEDFDVLTLEIGSLRERMKKSLGEAGIKAVPVEAFATKDARMRANIAIKFLLERWRKLKNDNSFKASIKFMEIPVWDLVREDFELYFSTRARIIEIVKFVETLREAIDKEEPDIIISLDELSELGMPMALLAKERKIPMLVIQHGSYKKRNFIFGPSLAAKKCVWGPYTKRLLLKRWFTGEQLVVTGCPKFDDFKKKIAEEADVSICYKLGLDPGKETILFIAWPSDYSVKAAKMLCDVIKSEEKMNQIQIIFKLHPRQMDHDPYKSLCKHMANNCTVTRTCDLHDAIKMSSTVVSAHSTADYDALIFGKPPIIIKLNQELGTIPLTEAGCSIEIKNERELKKALKEIKKPRTMERLMKNRKRLIGNQFYKIDGKATQRVMDQIHKLLT